MISMLTRVLFISSLGIASCFAGSCELLVDHNYTFYDNYANPNVVLNIGPYHQGQITYDNTSAPVQFTCDNNTISLSWNSSQINGYIKGYISLSGFHGLLVMEVFSGNMNGSKLPFEYLTTHVYGSGGL